jgi:hypothetical protein
MVPLTPEEIAKRRLKLADLDISDESKDELILLLDSIAISLVYQCMGPAPRAAFLVCTRKLCFSWDVRV